MRYPMAWSRWLLVSSVALVLTACAGAGGATPSPARVSTARPVASEASASTAPSIEPTVSAAVEPSPDRSQAPDVGGGTTSGDVPDNAVFLTYRGGNPAFAIQYVEGWQVAQTPDGLVIRDKDSSETVSIVAPQADVARYVALTDLPALEAQPDFKPGKQDTVAVRGTSYIHLVYHLPAPADPVTGKQVPSTVDRYYVPGPNGLAVVNLSTPDGVDNVDAFRQMIESFHWS
jgi:hypothetical protein